MLRAHLKNRLIRRGAAALALPAVLLGTPVAAAQNAAEGVNWYLKAAARFPMCGENP